MSYNVIFDNWHGSWSSTGISITISQLISLPARFRASSAWSPPDCWDYKAPAIPLWGDNFCEQTNPNGRMREMRDTWLSTNPHSSVRKEQFLQWSSGDQAVFYHVYPLSMLHRKLSYNVSPSLSLSLSQIIWLLSYSVLGEERAGGTEDSKQSKEGKVTCLDDSSADHSRASKEELH